MKTLCQSIGTPPLQLDVFIVEAGTGIQVYLGGGESPHIGSVAISQPRPSLENPNINSCTTSIINLLGHKDDKPAVLFAEGFCKKFNCVTVVSAGIHIVSATSEELQTIMRLSGDLLEKSLIEWENT